MSGRIEAVTSLVPSADAERAVEDFSALVARAGVILRVRRESAIYLGPPIRFEVRELGDLSHLHIQALVKILSRASGLTAELVVPLRGRKPFILPNDAKDCMEWFRDDRGSSSPRLRSTINRIVDRLRVDRS